MAKKKTSDSLLDTLRERFEQNPARHRGVTWASVEKKLGDDALATLREMEATGGEPDVVVLGKGWAFVDCAKETPKGRRSVCYDRAAWLSRNEHKPKTSAQEMAAAMGIEMLDEEQYAALQKVGPFDTTTSSWLKTPADVRKLGGAIFGDWRYGRVFTYHNGAESYYAARGFRGCLKV